MGEGEGVVDYHWGGPSGHAGPVDVDIDLRGRRFCRPDAGDKRYEPNMVHEAVISWADWRRAEFAGWSCRRMGDG